MKKSRSVMGLAILALAQAAARWGARKSGLPWSHRVKWQGGAWCAKLDGCDFDGKTPLHTMLFSSRYGRPYREQRVSLVRLGAVVAAEEWAPDGGGMTWLFLASDEVRGDAAEEMWQRQARLRLHQQRGGR